MDENGTTEEITVADLDQMIAELRVQREKVAKLTEELAPENGKLSQLEGKIAAALKALGRTNYSTEEGTFYFTRKWRFNLPAVGEARRSFLRWLEERGIADQYLTVNSNSYNSLLNQEREAALREGRLLSVPGVPEPSQFETISFRKGK